VQSVQKSRATSPATEVTAKAARRRFSAKYKKRIIDDAAACTAPGEIGALLRREGLYSSHLTKWRQQAERGELVGLEPKRRGPVPRTVDPRDRRLVELEKELDKVTRRAERAEALVEIQKKLSELLGIALPTREETT
jgi:transposase